MGFIADTPEAIELVGTLIPLRYALKLERQGMRSRHGSIRKRVRELTGVKSNDYDVLTDALDALIKRKEPEGSKGIHAL